MKGDATRELPVQAFDLAATLTSGQAFQWHRKGDAWEGVIQGRWIRLCQSGDSLRADTATPVKDWSWLTHYLQSDVPLAPILATFPQDRVMAAAVQNCYGLRLLRQDPWECLAGFILSSTKQISQIQHLIATLSRELGDAVPVPDGHPAAYSFPSPHRLAQVTESSLRKLKLGFRAPYLLQAARAIDRGELSLTTLGASAVDEARRILMSLPGVGRKIADCVLLFAYGFQEAFPVDVWIMKALKAFYLSPDQYRTADIERFTQEYFGPYRGYAQQYLFHYCRTHWEAFTRPSPTSSIHLV